MTAKIDKLILNSPYREPNSYWLYDDETKQFRIVQGRRKAGYFVAKPGAKKYDDEGRFIEIELANQIRERVKIWRENGYNGITNTTRDLLSHWHDDSVRQDMPFFFCQLDAIETLIFLAEASADYRNGIEIPNDGSEFTRLCTKLCTGGGKTIVMAMLIAWQVCNSVNYPRDKRFTRNILIVAPNLTVKKRLQVLRPDSEDENYYSRFQVLPSGMNELLNNANVIIHNWQALEPDKPDTRTVDKRGRKSDNAYANDIVGGMKNILVINDEAHHAYRITPELKKRKSKEDKEDAREATVWIESLDRIHRARRITCCYDFSATPFVMQNIGKNGEEGLFKWIVSDFGLSDGIESGIVKTPRIVVRDNAVPDAETYKSKFYHIYANPEVKDNLNSSAGEEAPLPDLVMNAYMMLGLDWKQVFDEWKAAGRLTPPVMITVANRTETAARIEYAFAHDMMKAPGLDQNLLRIDSRKLDTMNTEEALRLRDVADTVGKEGMPGEQVRNVISVGMLSEGWDARNVTHIMGLRAFTSQLLCEQIVGRGLRRTAYDVNKDGMFAPEYVNVFGIPFAFLPHEDTGGKSVPTRPATLIEVLPEREEYKITWPEVLRLEYTMKQTLSLDLDSVPELELNAETTRLNAELAPVIDGKTNLSMCSDIDLERLYEAIRMQRIIFDSAGRVYDLMLENTEWQKHGTKLNLLGQIIKLTEDYLSSGRIRIIPELFRVNETRRKIILSMNMERIIMHIWSSIKSKSTDKIIPVLNNAKRESSTSNMLSWYTNRPCNPTTKSHISHCVYDSTLESSTVYALEHNKNVKSYAKNDHLGFYVNYFYRGATRRYLPDFLVKLKNDITLILETKGIESEQDRIKRKTLREWVEAVNGIKIFGEWRSDMSMSPADVDGIIAKYI